jgi:hypothetical protein
MMLAITANMVWWPRARQQHSARTGQWRDQCPLLHHINRRPLRCTALRDVIHIDDVRNLDQRYISTWCGGHAP